MWLTSHFLGINVYFDQIWIFNWKQITSIKHFFVHPSLLFKLWIFLKILSWKYYWIFSKWNFWSFISVKVNENTVQLMFDDKKIRKLVQFLLTKLDYLKVSLQASLRFHPYSKWYAISAFSFLVKIVKWIFLQILFFNIFFLFFENIKPSNHNRFILLYFRAVHLLAVFFLHLLTVFD